MAAGFGKQLPTVETAAVVHDELRRGDVDVRQRYVDHGGDPGPERRGCGADLIEEGGDDVGGDL
ncbi:MULTISPECIES: hypothetical protein [Streptomyces]|uniref:Uncharacterized protein n=2 Tax=Streptomyces eurythermus TaxID=42237 RepID=A0ABW6Z7M7_9ACTN|nr:MULTISPECIES: hypothetical protein [Streptomyces]QIS68792.1 hypothetical protein HB370_01135 [Streptomyces sp. DSM 40868]WDM14633.1 hypothetical protein J3S85_25840 [Streptomyces lavenduligriseus]